jgi:uncharacterized membrane protein YdjX (TVP38/TMEM64 family)
MTSDPAARARLRLFGLLCAVTAAGIVTLVVLAVNATSLAERLDYSRPAQAVLIVLAGMLLVPALVPASVVMAASGFLLGTWAGMPVGLLGVTLGGAAAMLITRGIGGPAAHDALGRRVASMAAWLENRPFRGLLLARLVPGVPYNAVSYAAGLTRIPLATAAVASLIGFAPRAFAYAALGGSLRDLSSPEARWAIAATVALALLALVVPKPGRTP